MSDYLRSALGYLNGNSASNEYVGQVLEINNVKLRVTRLIAEGGWALVFGAEDISTGKEYALKRLIAADEETNQSIVREIEISKKLSGHPNVIRYLCARRIDREDGKGCEYLLVTELCPGGTLADLLRESTSLSLAQICRVAYQTTRAVHHMHAQSPRPMIHRDIKLENFLIGSDGLVKLCDFGSTTNEQILPDPSWNAQKRSSLEDQMSRYTTPMYRSPEIMDTWNNEPIGPPVDCWALGCIFYALVTLRHPFPEGNKLAITNARYPTLPANPRLSCVHELIKGCLEASPVKRLTTSSLLERLAAIAESNNFDPREPAEIKTAATTTTTTTTTTVTKAAVPPPRPSPPVASGLGKSAAPGAAGPSAPSQSSQNCGKTAAAPAHQASGIFSSLKGGAGSIFRNIKDTSTKVMHTVQQSMARTELDASYLTSRILVMPYPADGIESAYRANHVEDVRAYLQTRHPPPAKIQLYNLSRGRPNVSRLPGKHIDCNFAYASADSNAPLLSALYQITQDIYRYLDADFNHTVVLYCADGCRCSATIACALLLYAGAFATPEEAMALFATRRCQPAQLQPSELRMINYMSVLNSGVLPHTRPLVLRSLVLQPVPLFTRAKDGCRPYVEIYSNGALVFSTKRPEYEEMRLYDTTEGKACLILGDATVRGDATIVVSHARQQLGRVIGIKIASLHLHTGYVPLAESTLSFDKKDIDDTPEIGPTFRIILNVMIGQENPKITRIPAPWEVEAHRRFSPDPLFGSTLEMEETLENFRSAPRRPITPETDASMPEEPEQRGPSVEPEEISQRCDVSSRIEENEIRAESTRFAEADLLNLGTAGQEARESCPPPPLPPRLDIFASSSANENSLLGGFANFHPDSSENPAPGTTNPGGDDPVFGKREPERSNEKSASTGDFLFGGEEKSGKPPSNLLFDPLSCGTRAPGSGANDLLGNWSKSASNGEENFPRNSSVPNFAAQGKDPFGNLASCLGAGLNSSWNGTPRDSNTPRSASPVPSGTPIRSGPRIPRSNASGDTNAAVGGSVPSADSSLLNNKSSNNNNNKPGDAFEDLLGSQGYNFFSSRKAEKDSPKTINQMRKVEAAKTMDPDMMKVGEWTEGKKGNLRALLCSLHTVLWPEADRWRRYEMHQLVTPADVKKAYRKACLAVHPDKQTGTANENIAKLIFMELNNAWSAFENDASQQNLFS